MEVFPPGYLHSLTLCLVSNSSASSYFYLSTCSSSNMLCGVLSNGRTLLLVPRGLFLPIQLGNLQISQGETAYCLPVSRASCITYDTIMLLLIYIFSSHEFEFLNVRNLEVFEFIKHYSGVESTNTRNKCLNLLPF